MNPRPIEIFAVEDNEGDLFLIRRALDQCGVAYRLTIARSGSQALDMLETVSPQLVLLDLNLPRVHGMEVLNEIRRRPSFSYTPIIVLTSSESEKDRQRALAAGASAYFNKPAHFNSFRQLEKSLKQVLQSFGASSASAQ